MIKPKQRIPLSQKDKAWREENIKYFYNNCMAQNYTPAEINRLYRLANGYHDATEYNYITDSLGIGRERPELSGTPAQLRNMDIISPILMLLMGEKTKRPNIRIAFAKNSDYPSMKQEYEKNLWQKNLHTMFVNEMIKQGVYIPGMTDEEGQPIQEPKSKEEIDMEVNSLVDWQSVMAQEAVEYITHFNELDRNFRKGFYDWLVTASVFSYKTVRYDDVYYEIIPASQMYWLKGEARDFLEDGSAAMRRNNIPVNELIDNFRDLEGFTMEMLDDLDAFGNNYTSNTTSKHYSQSEVFYSRMFGESPVNVSNGDEVEVAHITWQSQQIVKRVKGTNVLGEQYEIEYDETYEALEGETVTESVHNQPWEGYMIGGKYIVGVQPIPMSRESMSNPSKKKLPYNGRIFHTREVRPKSKVEQGYEHQKKYNIVYFFLEKTMNKNKDKMTILPLSLIPDKPGWDEFTVMYYADATGYLFVDDADPANMQALQYVKTLDGSLSQYIQYIYGQLQQIKGDWEELAGINRQRKEGATNASDTVGGTQMSISRSVITTEELFVEYDEFEERELQGLVDISKYAFLEGKKGMYISPDGKKKWLELNPEAYQGIDIGIFLKNGGVEAEKMMEFKQSAFAFAQNQMQPSLVAKIVDSNNLEKLITEMIKAETEFNQRQQANQQALNQIEEQKVVAQQEKDRAKTEFDYYKVDADNNTKKEVALIQPPTGPDGSAQQVSKENIEQSWQQVEREKAVLKAISDKHKDDTALKVARANKNKYD